MSDGCAGQSWQRKHERCASSCDGCSGYALVVPGSDRHHDEETGETVCPSCMMERAQERAHEARTSA